MKHSVAPEEMIEMAASYSLGALSQEEARAFENHLAEGCQACIDELASFEATLTALAYAEEAEAPAMRIRDELIARMKGEALANDETIAEAGTDAPDFVSIRGSEGEWRRVQKGVLVKLLYVDRASGMTTSLVKMQPGTSLPIHQHHGVEQFFILEGDCNVCGEVLGPGDYHRAAAGSIHETTYTVNGTMFLLVAPKEYEVLGTRLSETDAGRKLT